MKSNKLMEKILQKIRFKNVIPFARGDVLDFGGNNGEFRKNIIYESYTLCNRDYSVIKNKKFDTIFMIAVLEHLENVEKTINMLKKHLKDNGKIIITTSIPSTRIFLYFMGMINLLDMDNQEEHKEFFSRKGLFRLAKRCNMSVNHYSTFELGLNQMIVLKKGVNEK